MPPRLDLVGQRFGRLFVLEPAAERGACGKVHWVCACDCGAQTTVDGGSLRTGRSRSCGCLKRDWAREMGRMNRTHGHAVDGRSPTYRSWESMLERCTNPRATGYANYGGRGITVCGRWRDFENFLADMGERPEGTTLDRIDNDRGYKPGNCRWATAKEQSNNRRPRRKRPAAA